jgi:hypothetical protein
MNRQQKIVDAAKAEIGQQEIKGNKGFVDEDFEERMREIGFQTGHAWCSYFAELIWKEGYSDDPEMLKFIKKTFSGSSYRTLKKFRELNMDSKTAVPGSVVIWRKKKNGEYTWQGHVGIVTEVHDDFFMSIEGNTNAAGSRDGEVVALKKRKYDWEKTSGLELAAFIHPVDVLVVAPTIPFKSKSEGDAFREWVNDNHQDVAEELDLDRSGSYNNEYIKKAWSRLYKEYQDQA